MRDRTIVILTSDNGGLLGPTDNTPLRAGKGHAYEGGIRVPLIIRWPRVVTAGTVCTQPVASVDFLPTIAAAVGVEPAADRDIDGVSLMGVLTSGGKQPLERQALYWHFPHYRVPLGPYSIVRAGKWKLIKWYAGLRELYNLRDDIGETNDLATTMPGVADQLEAQLAAELRRVDAKLPNPHPDYVPPAAAD